MRLLFSRISLRSWSHVNKPVSTVPNSGRAMNLTQLDNLSSLMSFVFQCVLAGSHREFEVITSGLVVREHLRFHGLSFVFQAERASAGFVRTQTVGPVIAGSRLIIVRSADHCYFSPFNWLTILRKASKDVPCKSGDRADEG